MVKQKQNSDTSYPALAKAARALLFVVALVALVPTFVAAVAWTHYSQSPRNIFCLLFVICPVVSISLTAIALRSPPYLRLRIAAFVAACALGAVASELLLSINAARAVELEPAARFVIRQRENGRSLHPYLAPTNFLRSDTGGTMRSRLSIDDKEILPVAGRSRSDLCPCNESGTPLVYRSDRFGMHNPDAVWDEAQLDIAVVGDSFAHGWCVPSESNFASHIRTLYPKTVNLGSAGHGPLLNLAAIREYLPSHKPKAVIWYHFEGNDFLDLEKEKKSPLLRKYLSDGFSQNLAAVQPLLDELIDGQMEAGLRFAIERKKISSVERLNRFLKLSYTRQALSLSFGYSLEYDLDEFSTVLQTAKRNVEAWGGRLHFVYLPWQDRYQRFASVRNYDAIKLNVLRCIEKIGVSTTDCDAAFLTQENPLTMFTSQAGGHYTEAGNRVVAESTLADIAKYDIQK